MRPFTCLAAPPHPSHRSTFRDDRNHRDGGDDNYKKMAVTTTTTTTSPPTAQLQQLTRDHRERSRAIAAEKQAIVNLQSDLLKGYARAGFAQPDLAHEDPQDAARRKAREELVRQLSDEQGPVEAALEALRAGRSLAEARSVGQKVYEELAELKQVGVRVCGRAAPPVCCA